MFHLKKLIVIATIAMSVFVVIGCGQDNSDIDKANQELIKQQKEQEEAIKTRSTSTTIVPWKNLEPSAFETLINTNSNIQILDVRDMYAFSNKRIPRADLLPLEQLAEKYTMIDKTKPILLYDNDGSRSKEAAKFLTSKGFTDLYTLSGGMEQWSGPVEP